MKARCFFAAFLLVAAASSRAQSTNTDNSVTGGGTEQHFLEVRVTVSKPKLNEILHQRFSYDGALVTAVKSHRPWELINPAAPVQYGSLEDSLVRDTVNGRVSGIKLFSIRF